MYHYSCHCYFYSIPNLKRALQITKDIQRLQEISGQRLQVVVGQRSRRKEGRTTVLCQTFDDPRMKNEQWKGGLQGELQLCFWNITSMCKCSSFLRVVKTHATEKQNPSHSLPFFIQGGEFQTLKMSWRNRSLLLRKIIISTIRNLNSSQGSWSPWG